MAFTSPYGIGYGLGAIGAGVAQGLLRGRELAPQLQYENLRNQMLQTQFANQQAEQQALSQMNPNQIQPGQQTTPYDQPLNDLNFYIQQLRQRGQGLQAAKLEDQRNTMMVNQRKAAIGKAAQEILYGDPSRAKEILNAQGFNIDSITPKPDGTFDFSAGGQVHNLHADEVAMVGADPDQLPNIFYRKQVLAGRAEGNRVRENIGYLNYLAKMEHEKNAPALANIRGQYQVQAQQERAKGQMGAANITQAGALQRMQMRPDVAAVQYMTDPDNGLGMDPQEANAALQQAKQNPRGIDQLVENAAKQHPEWSANDVVEYRKTLSGAMGAPAPTTPRAPVKPRAAGGLPPELKGAPPQVIEAYNQGKEITLPSGKKLKK